MSCAVPVPALLRYYYYSNYQSNDGSAHCLQGGIRSNDDRAQPGWEKDSTG